MRLGTFNVRVGLWEAELSEIQEEMKMLDIILSLKISSISLIIPSHYLRIARDQEIINKIREHSTFKTTFLESPHFTNNTKIYLHLDSDDIPRGRRQYNSKSSLPATHRIKNLLDHHQKSRYRHVASPTHKIEKQRKKNWSVRARPSNYST